MVTLEQIGNLINGIYLAVKEDNHDLLNKTVLGLEGKYTNPLFRAYMSYRNLQFKYVYMCLKLSAEYLRMYYGKIPTEDSEETDEIWADACSEIDRRIMAICHEDEENRHLKEYATGIFVECMNVLDEEYKKRKLNSNNV